MKKVLIISNNLECDELVGYFSKLELYFLLNGWEVTKSFNADLILVVACGAIEPVHEYVKNALNDILSAKGNFDSTIIMGCQVDTHRSRLEKIYNGKMISYGHENEIDELINAKYPFESTITPNVFNMPQQADNKIFTIIISSGCLMKCSYCIIKKAHGYIKSESVDKICEQFNLALRNGYKNIALAGTDTSVYGIDIGSNIITLIKKLREIDSTVKFYIENLHTHSLTDYYDDFMQLASENAFSYLHIALQHVDKDIIKRMGRDTDFDATYDMIKNMKQVCKDLIIYTDFIFGFPGETEQQFQKLLNFVETDEYFDYYYLHDYSDIEGTESYKFADKIDDDTMKKRGTKITIAFERRKKEKIKGMNSEIYRIFKKRYDIESGLKSSYPKGYYTCKETFIVLENS